MVNYIWGGMILTGLIVAFFTGRMDEVNQAIFQGAKTGVNVSFTLIGFLTFWMGLMKIAELSGLLDRVTSLLKPVVRFLFPDLPRNHPAVGYILMNLSANLLGLGNAATPMGLKAMQELQNLNADKTTASRPMITFLALNTAGLTLIPTTVIAYRMAFESNNPVEIVGATFLATLISTSAAILADRYYQWRHR